MSDSKLHLMSFAPVPDTKTTVHVVGLPDSLRDALFTLMPPRKEGGYLNTKVLKDDLRCWLDRAVELNPVRPNVHTDSWLIALAPIDLAKLCNVIAVWISSRKDIDTQSPAYCKVMGMLHPETFEEAVHGEETCLFSGDGRPTGRLTFPAFSAQVADAIADIPLELANGMVENFSRVSRGNGNVYELISDIHWHKEDPWAFALRFHVETLPVGRKARLNMDVAVRRFIGKPWQDDPFLKHDVNAYVRTEGGTLRVVPYGYDKQKRDLAWDPAALANYEFASGTGLPAVREYLEGMGRYARDGSQPQILSPYAMTASWASKPSVASGASVIDKAMFFEAVAARLKDIAEPVGALDSLQLTHLKASIEEPRQADWDKDPVGARARQEAWGRANRARLARCTGRDRAVFQLIGNQDDARLLDMARAEISCFLGGEGAVDGFEVEIDNIPANDLLNRMENTGDSQAKIRWRKVAAAASRGDRPDRVHSGPAGRRELQAQGQRRRRRPQARPAHRVRENRAPDPIHRTRGLEGRSRDPRSRRRPRPHAPARFRTRTGTQFARHRYLDPGDRVEGLQLRQRQGAGELPLLRPTGHEKRCRHRVLPPPT